MISSTLTTFIIAFILILIACAGLGIGLILTGKSKLRKSCGGNFGGEAGKKCDKTKKNCDICGARKQPKESDNDKN